MTEEQKQKVLDNKGLIFIIFKELNLEPTEDNIQDAYIGLIRGVKQFDESKGFKLSTYLTRSIKYTMFAKYNLDNRQKRKTNQNYISLYENIAEDLMVIETIRNNVDIEKELLIKERNEELYAAISTLKPSYQKLLEQRFGLNNTKAYTLVDLAKMYGVTRQALSNKLEIIYRKLREKINGTDRKVKKTYTKQQNFYNKQFKRIE